MREIYDTSSTRSTEGNVASNRSRSSGQHFDSCRDLLLTFSFSNCLTDTEVLFSTKSSRRLFVKNHCIDLFLCCSVWLLRDIQRWSALLQNKFRSDAALFITWKWTFKIISKISKFCGHFTQNWGFLIFFKECCFNDHFKRFYWSHVSSICWFNVNFCVERKRCDQCGLWPHSLPLIANCTQIKSTCFNHWATPSRSLRDLLALLCLSL